jgi:hypothetical protein
MKKTKFVFAVLMLSAVLFTACKKKQEDPQPTTITTVSGAIIPQGGTYAPSNAGTTWEYNSPLSGASKGVMTGNTKTVDGMVFFETKVTSSKAESYSYVSQNGNQYYYMAGSVTSPEKFIDLDLPLGTVWQGASSSSSNINTSVSYRMVGVNLTRTVNNVNYSNVIQVEKTTQLTYTSSYLSSLLVLGVPQSTINSMIASLENSKTVFNTYYALNVGGIENVGYSTLVSYSIK